MSEKRMTRYRKGRGCSPFSVSWAHSGSRINDEGSPNCSWVHWWLLAPSTREDDELINDLPVAPAMGSGPGQMFHNYPSVRRTATRTLVTQFGGYDV